MRCSSTVWKIALLVCMAVVGLSGCRPRVTPNTDVRDTEFNRRVVEFCEEYRRAVERRNVALLLKFADPNYYEDGGNIDATDDIDYAGLREYLQTRFAEALRDPLSGRLPGARRRRVRRLHLQRELQAAHRRRRGVAAAGGGQPPGAAPPRGHLHDPPRHVSARRAQTEGRAHAENEPTATRAAPVLPAHGTGEAAETAGPPDQSS